MGITQPHVATKNALKKRKRKEKKPTYKRKTLLRGKALFSCSLRLETLPQVSTFVRLIRGQSLFEKKLEVSSELLPAFAAPLRTLRVNLRWPSIC